MAKAKKSTICKNICLLVALVFALVSLGMIFTHIVTATDGSVSYRGYEVVFGYYEELYDSFDAVTGAIMLRAVWSFSFANFMTYLSLILAIVCCIGAIAYKKQGLVLSVLTMLLFLSAGMGFLNQAGNLQPYTMAARKYYEGLSMTPTEVNTKINEIIMAARNSHTICWTAYFAAGCCFVAAVSALLSKILWQAQYLKENKE